MLKIEGKGRRERERGGGRGQRGLSGGVDLGTLRNKTTNNHIYRKQGNLSFAKDVG